MTEVTRNADEGEGTKLYRFVCHVLLTCTFVLSTYDRHVLGVLVEPIKHDLHLSDTQIGLLQGFAFAICYATAALPVAWMVDTRSRVRIAGACVAVWSLGTAACGLAGNFTSLLFGRTLTAIAEAGYSPAALSLISDTFPKRFVPKASAIYLVAPSLGLGLALIGGGALLQHFTAAGAISLPLFGQLAPWQSVLMVSAAPGVLLALLAFAILREPARQEGIIADRADLSGESSVADQRNTRQVMAKSAPFLVPYVAGCTAILLVMFTLAAWAPAMFSRTFELTPAAASKLIGPLVLVGGIFGPLLASVLLGRAEGWDVIKRMTTIVAGAGVAACCLVPVLAFAPTKILAAITLGAIIFAVSMVAPMVVAPIQILVPSSFRGRAQAGASFLFTVVAGGIGPALVGFIADHLLGNELKLGLAVAMVCAASAVAGVTLICLSRRWIGIGS